MVMVVARKAPVSTLPPTNPAPPVLPPPPPADTNPQVAQALMANLEQMTQANDAFLAALKHEFAKQNYKAITATVERDKTGRIAKIHMEVER